MYKKFKPFIKPYFNISRFERGFSSGADFSPLKGIR